MYYLPLRRNKKQFIDADSVTLLSDVTLLCTVVPSDNVYFDQFLYKITFEGNSVWHDMDFHFALSEFVESSCTSYRMGWSVSCRSIYFTNFDDVRRVVDNFKHGIIAAHGPINSDHLALLLGTSTDKGMFKRTYRERYFYNKYDCKIEFSVWKQRHKYKRDSSPLRDIEKLIAANSTTHKWSTNSEYVLYKSVYLTFADAEVILPLLKLTYKEHITDAVQVFLKTDLLKDKK